MARPFRIVAVVLLSLSLGLHWTVAQSVAWAGMLASRAHTGSLAAALRTTFDGQHPCPLCRAVAAGKAAEQQAPAGNQVSKPDFFRADAVAVTVCPPVVEPPVFAESTVRSRGADSPVPPPPRVG